MKQVAIVTGHTSGLGQAFTNELLARNYSVIGVARRPAINPVSDQLFQVPGSVASQAVVDEAFEMVSGLGSLRIVVNCAGQGVFGEVGSYKVAEIQTALEGNLLGLIAFTDRAVNTMNEAGGDIVNVMSTASKKLRTAESVYTASKWGAKAYTRTVRDAVKAKKFPIRIFEVYPCGMNTNFWHEAVRPVTDGKSFPKPEPIASTVLDAVQRSDDSYQQEFTFERS